MRSFARWIHAGFAVSLVAAAPLALGQKMYKCPDGAGGTTFQQQPCPETAKEAEARQKEKERIEAEVARKKEEEAKKKADAIQKAKERDQAYQEAEKQRAEERRLAAEAEKKIMQGTSAGTAAAAAATAAAAAGVASPAAAGAAAAVPSDGSLPDEVAAIYPAPWKKDANAVIVGALTKKQVAGCGRFEYRPRVNNGADVLVHCLTGAQNYYDVWPATEGVRGPVKF